MPTARLAPTFAFVVISLACGASGIPGPPAGLPHAAARPACGPADGPAVQILLASAPVGTAGPATPYVSIYIWEGVDQLSERVLVVTRDNADGSVWYQLSPSESVLASSGIVRITSVSADNTIEGSADLTFPRGRRVRGGFRASWIPGTMLCG